MKLRDKILGIGRFAGAAAPLVLVVYSSVLYARTQTDTFESRRLERRLTDSEIALARQDEKTRAIIARIDSIDKTLWWLIVATFGGTGVSGAVAADRAAHKWRQARERQ